MSEKKSVQANDRNYSSVPSTYVFKKRGTIRGDNQTKLPSSRVLSIRPNSDDAPVKNRPPQTYQFRRLQIDRYDDNDNVILNKQLSSDSTGVPTDKRILQRIRDEEEQRSSRFENVPKSYRLNTTYRREDPPASHCIIVDKTTKKTENMRIHQDVIPDGCGCWFNLYNGYCCGHRLEARSYFNTDPYSSNDRLAEWTRSPLLSAGQYQVNSKASCTSIDIISGDRNKIRARPTDDGDFEDESICYDD